MKYITLSIAFILILTTSAYANGNDAWITPPFSADEINLKDSPAGLDQSNPSRWITQVIDNTFHEWKEFDLKGDGFCILMIEPEYKWLTAEESRALLKASNQWVEQATAREEENLYKKEKGDKNDEFNIGESNDKDNSNIEKSGVIGIDNRERVPKHEVQSYPYNTIGMLREPPSGTGFLVAPNTILTCAHVAFDRSEKRYRTGFDFAPGLYESSNQAVAPYGRRSDMPAFFIDPDYLKALESDADWDIRHKHDIGAIYFEKPFEEITTFMPLKYDYKPNDEKIYTSGYPKYYFWEHFFKWAQYRVSGIASVHSHNDRLLEHTADTTKGQSGSPIWIKCDDTNRLFVIAIVSGSFEYKYHGPRLVSENKDLIDKWMQWETVKSVNLIASPSSPTDLGETITFTAQAEGGVDPEYQFYFRIKGTESWSMVQPYCSNNTFEASPKNLGSYDVGVTARSKGSNQDRDTYDIIEHKVEVEPVKSVTLNVSPQSPTAPGESITLTASSKGGVRNQYLFALRPMGDKDWIKLQGFGPENSIELTPGEKHVGEYEIIALAKSYFGLTTTDSEIITHTIEADLESRVKNCKIISVFDLTAAQVLSALGKPDEQGWFLGPFYRWHDATRLIGDNEGGLSKQRELLIFGDSINTISLKQFVNVKPGMSYQEANDLLGMNLDVSYTPYSEWGDYLMELQIGSYRFDFYSNNRAGPITSILVTKN